MRWCIVGAMLLASACLATDPPEGVFECTTAAQCPADWTCRSDRLCWRTPDDLDAGIDAGRDAGPLDAGEVDAGPPDGGFVVTLYGLDLMNRLITFPAAPPISTSTALPITGLQGGEEVVGMTIRTLNGRLFILGDTSRLYTVDIATGIATPADTSPFTPALSGTRFGTDFIPNADRIRVVSDAEQNFRLLPVTTAVISDDALNPAGSIVSIAHTNAYFGAVTTTLYGIDWQANTLVRIGGVDGVPSANLGAVTTIGPLGIDTGGNAALDIDGRTNTAYASLTVGGVAQLYTIDLSTGAATQIGLIGDGSPLRAIQVIPE